VTKPSKGAAVFFVFFGLMFLVPGLLSLFTFLSNSGNHSTSSTVAAAAIAVFISAIGAGLLFVAVGGYRRMKKQAAIEEANPSAPWLWRADWAIRKAESLRKNKEVAAWVACIFCNLVMIPVAISAIPQLARSKDPRIFLVLAFGLIPAILLVYAIRATLRRQRFGNTYFEFYSLPFSPGGRLAGRIHLKLDSNASHGVDLRISCVRKMITGSGNSRSTSQTVLWQSEQNVPFGAIGMDALGRAIPVDFAIPADAYVTDHDNPSDQVLWFLYAQADIPGVDYTDDFELPVFKTSASVEQSSAFSSSSETFGSATGSFSESETASVAAPANPKVIISSQAGGTEFYFPAFRTPSRALFLLIFTSIWTGVVYFLLRSSAPWFFPIVFGFFDVILIFAMFHVVFGTSRIRVGNGELTSTTRVLGIGSTKRYSTSEIEAIVAVTSGQQGGNNGQAMYAIRLRTKNGRRVTLADEITSRQEARWVVSQIETLAGLKIDTHVEVESLYGPPPQPGQPLFNTSQSGPLGQGGMRAQWQQRRSSQASTVISMVVFALFAASMIAWQGWRFSNLKAASASRANKAQAKGTPRVAATANVVASRGAVAAKMTDADAERVLVLPPQEQAEELLERAIGHDPRALELFEQQVESWVGHINLTDHMRQLERRSEFSRDLRVRNANADINLTLDGWQKNDQAAEMLIERASTDLHYRAAAVYFLGMLAGRGVAYDRIHPVLLDYAKHDPDPAVRQWAVEGMRYLGKDEALDELFESFTQDSSSNVRERAGCNISDCGNFTRVQRMRMVPKFVDLLADANTSAQMKTWSYMALREITDANVASDPQAWRNWFQAHGSEKMAEFGRLDWWKVRGDE
jgi:hypothetical protein